MEEEAPEEVGTQEVDSQGAGTTFRADDDGRGNPFLQLRSQIQELGRRHDQVMSTPASLSTVNSRSYVYIPRERQLFLTVVTLVKTVRPLTSLLRNSNE